MPTPALVAHGSLTCAAWDRRDNPNNVLNEVSYTFSVGGGSVFAHNVRLTQAPSSSQIGQQYDGAPLEQDTTALWPRALGIVLIVLGVVGSVLAIRRRRQSPEDVSGCSSDVPLSRSQRC